MKYLSVFFAILFIWIAVLIIVAVRSEEANLQLFLITVVATILLFLIGFAKR